MGDVEFACVDINREKNIFSVRGGQDIYIFWRGGWGAGGLPSFTTDWCYYFW